MRYIVDTDKLTIFPINKASTIADFMEQKEGAKEWDSTVTEIQKWFYGNLSKTAWCATSLSYFADIANVGEQTGRFENVDSMKDFMNTRKMLDCTAIYGGGNYKAKRGDIIFFSSYHSFKDCTHVGVVQEIDHTTGSVKWIGGNTDDSIKSKTSNYKKDNYVVAFGRVDYHG